MVPELKRLRLSSIDSIEADDDLMRVIAEDDRLMPHFHLSLQAGDDMILKRMKRRHLRADTIRFCEEVRRMRPDVVFGADIIAGFPTETDEMFENSLKIVDECGLTHLACLSRSLRARAHRQHACRNCRATWSRTAAPGFARRVPRRWLRIWQRKSARSGRS